MSPPKGASPRRRGALLAAVLAACLLLGGCRSRAGVPATGSGGAAAGDPLAGIEATVDAVDREISADAAAPDDPGSRPAR